MERSNDLYDISGLITAFGSVTCITMDQLLDNVLQSLLSLPRDFYRQLRTNVEYLVLSCSDLSSQKSENVDFDDYLLLMFRYGPRARIATIMLELADPTQSQGTVPNFQQWFHPELTVKTAEMVLRRHTRPG
jgi:hypothetical protein